jgi:hypothetical protein
VVAPTFKWSRDNGTVAFVVTEVDGSETPWTVYLQDFGRDSRFSLDIGDWVEIIDRPARPLEDGAAPDLLRVTAVDPIDRSVTLERPLDQGTAGGPPVQGVPPVIAYDSDAIAKRKPILRRWDHSRGVVETRKAGGPSLGTIVIDRQRLPSADPKAPSPAWSNPDDPGTWFELEDGIRVQFQRPAPDVGSVGIFRPGNYWLIPARTASNGTILWTVDENEPNGRAAVPPQGPRHSYAPLAVVVDPASNPGHPENWVIDRRTHINRGNIVTGPS